MRKTVGLCLGLAAYSFAFAGQLCASSAAGRTRDEWPPCCNHGAAGLCFFRSACFWEIELYDLRSVESGSVLTMYLDTERGPILAAPL